jgi:hypothetical protein
MMRMDIMYTTFYLSRYQTDPRLVHWNGRNGLYKEFEERIGDND